MAKDKIIFLPAPMIGTIFFVPIPKDERERNTIDCIKKKLSECGINENSSFDDFIKRENDYYTQNLQWYRDNYKKRFVGDVNLKSVKQNIITEINNDKAKNVSFNKYVNGIDFSIYNYVLNTVTANVLGKTDDGLFRAKAPTVDFAIREVIISLIDGFAAAKYIQEIEKKSLENIHSEKKKNSSRKNISYKWLGNDDEIPDLFKKMKGILIDSGTTKNEFSNIFSGIEIDKINPVKWHNDNASELLYFILQLEEKNLIAKRKHTSYIKLSGCFIKNNGCKFHEQFRALKQNLDIQFSNEKKQIIDAIIKQFW